MKRVRPSFLCLAVVLCLITSILPASAIGPIITGTVRDRFGDPIAGARVSDGAQVITTANDGRYSFTETSPSWYTITASKATYVTQSIQVNTLTNAEDQDLSLPYTISTSVNRRYISTAAAAWTLEYTVVTPAPDPSVRSCAFSKDTATGQTSAMTYMSSSGGLATWMWSKSLGVGSTEGNFILEGWAQNCATGVNLDLGNASRPYTVDNTGPIILPQSLTPSDRGLTMFPSQVLAVMTKDGPGGAGVSSSDITFTLRKGDDSLDYPAVAYNAVSWWAKSSPVSLTANETYHIAVEVMDRAGNLTTLAQDSRALGGGFHVSNVSSSTAIASIPLTPCQFAGPADLTGYRPVECPDAQLVIGSSTVSIPTNPLTARMGFLRHTIPLSTAKLRADDFSPFETNAFPASEVRMANFSFVASRNHGPSNYNLPGRTLALGTVKGRVPAYWTSAKLEMPPVSSIPDLGACNDPSTKPRLVKDSGCTPDPLANRFLVTLKDSVSDPNSQRRRHMQELGVIPVEPDGNVANSDYVAEVPPSILDALSGDAAVAAVTRIGGHDVVKWWAESPCGAFKSLVIGYMNFRNLESFVDIATRGGLAVGNCEAYMDELGIVTEVIDKACEKTSCDDPDPCPTTDAIVFSTSHTVIDPPGIDLAWLRAMHLGFWDGCNSRWGEPLKLRTGSGPSWWHHAWPYTTYIHWFEHSVATHEYEALLWSEGNAPDCDVRVRSGVYLTNEGDGMFVSVQSVDAVNGAAACSWLREKKTETKLTYDNGRYYTGNDDDKQVYVYEDGEYTQ